MVSLYRLGLLAGGALTLAGLTAQAADQPPAGALAEVVVTAQKRSESEQTVPLSMTTFGGVALEQKAIATFFDYGTKVPNLAFAPTGDGIGTARTISIRGIGGDSATGFYIDETPLPDSIDPRVLDVDHIEVLRGPQGTLFGARSMGGTVRVMTKQPSLTEFESTVHVGVSSTDRADRPNWTGDGIVNIPLMQDRVALRLSGFYDSEAGYFKRSFCTDPATAGITCFPLSPSGVTTVKNIGAIDSYGGAATLTFKVNDAVTITPRIMLQRSSFNGFPMSDFLTVPGNGVGYAFGPDGVTSGYGTVAAPSEMKPSNFTQARLLNMPESGHDSWGLYSLGIKWKTGAGEFVSSTAYFERKVFETEDEGDFIWGQILSWLPVPAILSPISEAKNYQRFAQEVRFASELKGPTQFVIGGFYSDFHGRVPYASYYPPSLVPGLDALIGPTSAVADLIFAQDFHTKVKEPAAFGELSYQANDKVKLTAGLRWYQVKSSSYGYEEGLATGGGPAIVSPLVETTETGVNPKFEADYHFSKDQMVYATVAKGFRPGGVLPIVPTGLAGTATDCTAALAAQAPKITAADTRSFKSDSLWNYEVGTKNSTADHRVTFNAAAFYIKQKNTQQLILLSCGFQFITNALATESKGGELEVHARATDRLELSLGLGYQDAKITEASTSPQPVGSPVLQVPDWTGNGSATYTAPLTGRWNLVSGVDVAYVGRSYSGTNLLNGLRLRPAYTLVDARFACVRGPFEVALVGKNLSNEAANLGDSRSIAIEVFGRPRLWVNPPRTIGLEFRNSF